MSRHVKIGLGLAVSAASLWFTFRGFDFGDLRRQAAIFSLGWVFPAAAMMCLSFAIRSARWWAILSTIRPMRFWTVAPTLVFGFFMNSVLPARGGELARAVAIAKNSDVPVSSALGTIVVERTLDLVALALTMLVASRLLPWEKLPIRPIAATALALVVVIAAGAVFLPRLPLGRSPLAQKVISFIAQVGAGFSAIKRPSRVFGLLLASISIWALDIASVATLSRAAALDLSFTQAAALVVGIAVGVMIPAAPGYVGTYEFFGKEMLTMIGYPAVPALAFVVFLHFFQLAMMVILGVPSTIWVGASPKEAPVP